MYIPKKNRIDVFLKKKNGQNWSRLWTHFIKDLLRQTPKAIPYENNIVLDPTSEFQKSYVSFPEFNDSDAESCSTVTTNANSWVSHKQ
jgi:hypothetical protein